VSQQLLVDAVKALAQSLEAEVQIIAIS